MEDDKIKEQVLANRILITKNTKDFEEDVSSYDFGIIALEALSFIDPDSSDKNQTVKLISRAISKHSLWSARQGFIARLKDDGSVTLETVP
jgi:CCR4-NOT transcriptional regulation complex NOT5 subunit